MPDFERERFYSKQEVNDYYFGSPKYIASKVLFIKRETRLHEYKRLLSNVYEFGNVWRGLTGNYNGEGVTIVATDIGPSMVGDCAYALHKPEAVCLYSGTCGGIRSDLKIGDFFVAQTAVCADGFSQLLGREFLSLVDCDPNLLFSVQNALIDLSLNPSTGKVFTTASAVLETTGFFWRNVDSSCHTIEMECASFYSASIATGKHPVAYFWVTDLPLNRKSFFDSLTEDERKKKQEIYDRIPRVDLEVIAKIKV